MKARRRNPSFEMWTPDKRSVARFWSNEGTRWDVAIYGDRGEQRLQSKRGVTKATAEKWARKMLTARMRNPADDPRAAVEYATELARKHALSGRPKYKGVTLGIGTRGSISPRDLKLVKSTYSRVYDETKALKGSGRVNPRQMIFRTKADALKYARARGVKKFSIRKLGSRS